MNPGTAPAPPGATTRHGTGSRPETTAGPQARARALTTGAGDDAHRAARAHIRDTLTRWGLAPLIPDAVQITAELVANAITQAASPRDPVTIAIAQHSREICISVWDPSPDPPPRHHQPGQWDEHGRGLLIITALSHHWDWHPAPGGGKHTWATLLTESPPPG